MLEVDSRPWPVRLNYCFKLALPTAARTSLWLLSIMVPVSFAVLLMKMTGILNVLAGFAEPLFSLFGLPGNSALVFVTSCLLNIYSCIAVIETLGLSGRAVTILALMCLISHNLPVETAVQKKTGSHFLKIIFVRLGASFVGAFFLNLMLPADQQHLAASASNASLPVAGIGLELKTWLFSILYLCAKVIILVTLLMILQRILEEFGVTQLLSNILKYPLMLLGIPYQAAFLWIVANTLGLAYGAGVIVDHVERGRLSRKNSDILNYHIAVSHSLLEDTLLFVAIGVCAWWITIPRVILAGIVVWLKRLIDWVVTRKEIQEIS
ncbi:MAG TPA: hypothetical protein PK874_01175 [Desulfobacteraceae bacterium]|nr:hypothetical protein [Desulfobacteraceae bacterium]HPJ68064.1 hypothetical protein [Desulfobacteraceae bacterium]HPQ28405.1 hypothetical protein [Desulfobacteraceae bacterium]